MSFHRSLFSVAALVTVASAMPAQAEACSCLPVTLESAWHNSTDTMLVRVLKAQTASQQFYKVEVLQVFSGCLQKGDVVFVQTPLDSASCGETLTLGSKYVITANEVVGPKPDTFEISLCGYNRLQTALTADEKDFLNSREVVCDDTGLSTCVDGSQPVVCFVDPCTVETCGVAGSVCEANYCGGCNAEFYDAGGFPVCL